MSSCSSCSLANTIDALLLPEFDAAASGSAEPENASRALGLFRSTQVLTILLETLEAPPVGEQQENRDLYTDVRQLRSKVEYASQIASMAPDEFFAKRNAPLALANLLREAGHLATRLHLAACFSESSHNEGTRNYAAGVSLVASYALDVAEVCFESARRTYLIK